MNMPRTEHLDDDELVFLKPEVKMEPLVCRWYAWPHLLAPAQLALHIAFRVLPLLKSFATNPAIHIAANRDPKMFGGPFMSLAQTDVPEINRLLEETVAQCAKLTTLAADLRSMAGILEEKANGYSLNDCYALLPDSLKGLVEFLYDTNNHASMRLFEELMHDEELVSPLLEIMLHPVGEKERHFFMSTPRLRVPGSLSFALDFRDPRIDALASMRSAPASFAGIARQLAVGDDDLAAFRAMFMTTPPRAEQSNDFLGDGVRIRHFGHACVLIQTNEVSILFDPFVAIEPGDDGRLTYNDLPDVIDYVVLSHSHQDHFCAEMLLQLRHRIRHVIAPINNNGALADPSMKLGLKALGFTRVNLMNCYDTVEVPGGVLTSLPFTGENCDLNVYSKHTILLTLKGQRILFLVDSDGRDPVLYKRLMQRIGKVDALFIGMECHGGPLNWLYEPLLTKPINRRNNESRRLSGADCERAWSIVTEIKPAQVFIYAMGQDPWMAYIMGLQYTSESIQLVESDKFIAMCAEQGIHAERLVSGRELELLADIAAS